MDWLCIFLTVLLAVFCHLNQTFASVLEMTVKPGNNIILYCDCKVSTGVFIVWYKNCSHKNHPTPLKLKRTTTNYTDPLKFPNFHYLRNYSSDSYDLLILNINDSDEGLYYCGTEENKVEDKEYIKWKTIYKYGRKATRILLNTDPYPECSPCTVCGVPWVMMPFVPALTVLSSYLAFILVYHICQKTGKQSQDLYKRTGTNGPTRHNQDEDVCLTRVVFHIRH
ncbi:uncharacterized protein LOC113162318 isoform X2 [Anabas testudineus]|uniref:uncharacterized protein LOC113162318 isoform X2 n=1 Tax=Anabas testudineus TaxID=64144 RepID=UPI000E456C29|nr:uncharacterized protein LOC113162318 isoform X2 [Anabas testudineus]